MIVELSFCICPIEDNYICISELQMAVLPRVVGFVACVVSQGSQSSCGAEVLAD